MLWFLCLFKLSTCCFHLSSFHVFFPSSLLFFSCRLVLRLFVKRSRSGGSLPFLVVSFLLSPFLFFAFCFCCCPLLSSTACLWSALSHFSSFCLSSLVILLCSVYECTCCAHYFVNMAAGSRESEDRLSRGMSQRVRGCLWGRIQRGLDSAGWSNSGPSWSLHAESAQHSQVSG